MNELAKIVFLETVRTTLAAEPGLFQDVIGMATAGVKQFASEQRDLGTQAQFRLMCVLDSIEPPGDGKFGPFTTEEVLNCLEGCFGGTKGLKQLRIKYGVPERITND